MGVVPDGSEKASHSTCIAAIEVVRLRLQGVSGGLRFADLISCQILPDDCRRRQIAPTVVRCMVRRHLAGFESYWNEVGDVFEALVRGIEAWTSVDVEGREIGSRGRAATDSHGHAGSRSSGGRRAGISFRGLRNHRDPLWRTDRLSDLFIRLLRVRVPPPERKKTYTPQRIQQGDLIAIHKFRYSRKYCFTTVSPP